MSNETISFVKYDDIFLEKSWHWLNDREIKALTMTPDFTRESQKNWFSTLDNKDDYKIWGVSFDGKPIGACGLKHITQTNAECWEYIGEKEYWGKGLGKQMIIFCINKAKEKKLKELYAHVISTNERSIKLHSKIGFSEIERGDNGLIKMNLKLLLW